MRPLRGFAALALMTAVLAGCGGSSEKTTPTTTGGGAATTTGTGTTGTTGGGISTTTATARAGQTPQQLLDAMRVALAKVKSYHVDGKTVDKKDGPLELSGDVTAAGPVQLRIKTGVRVAELIVLGKDSYIRANRAYWEKTGGSGGAMVTTLLANRWVLVPSSKAGTDGGVFEQLLPKRLAHCTGADAGDVSNAGTGLVGGVPVVRLSQKGSAPGTSPGVLSIAATGPARPIEITQTGPEKPGGKQNKDPLCDAGSDSGATLSSAIRFSRYDAPVKITAPPNALDLSKIGQGGSTSA